MDGRGDLTTIYDNLSLNTPSSQRHFASPYQHVGNTSTRVHAFGFATDTQVSGTALLDFGDSTQHLVMCSCIASRYDHF
jgi:hypothetical protein